MLRYTVQRLFVASLVALAVSLSTFSLLFLAGDPATALAGSAGTAGDVERFRALYGLDRPILVQYFDWLWRALHGNFGTSAFLNMPAATVVLQRLPLTLAIGSLALAFGLLVAVPLGIVAALRPNSILDRCLLFFSVLGQATPNFWLGLMLLMLFGVRWAVLPTSGADSWLGLILPTAVLGYFIMPTLMRLTRAGMLDVLQSDYIRAARAKGLPAHRIILRHALKNAALPLVSIAAVQFGVLLSGSIVIESVFALDGMGRLAWESLLRSDMAVVQAIILTISGFYIVLTLASDLINAWLDPRIRR